MAKVRMQKLFSSRKCLSLRGKLLLLVLVPLGVTLIASLALTLHGLTRLEANTSKARLQEEVRIISQQVAHFEEDLSVDSSQLAADPALVDAVQRADQAALQAVLLSTRTRLPYFDYLQIADIEGQVLATKQSFGLDAISSEVEHLDTRGASEIRTTRLVPVVEGWLFTVVRPLETQPATIVGTLSAGRLLRPSSTPSTLNFQRRNPRVVLLDAQGNFSGMLEVDTQEGLEEEFVIDRNLWAQAASGQVSFGQTNLRGEIQQVAYVPVTVGEQTAVFCIILSTADSTDLRDQLLVTNLVVAGLLTALASAAALSFGNRVVIRPITVLMAAVKQITAGQFEVLVPGSASQDEIGMLGDAFNRMAAELRRTIAREKAILHSALDCIINIDHHGQIIEFNPAAEKTFGYRRTQALGRKMSELIDPSSWEGQVRKNMSHYFAVGQGTMIGRRFEVTAKRADGTAFPAELALTVTRFDGLPLFSAFVRDITARKEAEEQIRVSLKEKESMLQEIHHRVKNNLQVISSLLRLQTKYIEDAKALDILRDSQHRIRSMALIHEKLYQSDNLAQVDFAEYIRDLAMHVSRSYDANTRNISLNIQADKVFLGIDMAIPCGLIINELVSNALKHAFRCTGDGSPGRNGFDRQMGEIRIQLNTEGAHQFALIVSDNGIGFPEDLDFRNTTSLGLHLVNTLVDELGGTVELDSGQGTHFRITFTAPSATALDRQP